MFPLLVSLCIFLFSLLPTLLSQPLQSFRINCGGSAPIEYDGHQWQPDSNFISVGTPRRVPYESSFPVLSTVRSFPRERNNNKKFCYEIGPVTKTSVYLIRTTYFYGQVNGDSYKTPPVFDQIVDGTLWGLVNTTDDFADQRVTYYEGVFKALGKTISVCLGINEHTDSDPFISGIEMFTLADSVYNSTDFGKFGLSLVTRNNFGYQGPIVRMPDDSFDRIWQPFGPNNPIEGVANVSVSGFWNLPPSKIFETNLATNARALELEWPQGTLQASMYYIALYFADDNVSSSGRALSISINDVQYFANLSVTSSGVAVFATQWPLAGRTNFKFTQVAGSNGGPLINGGEVFSVLTLGRRTLVRDVIALQSIKRSLDNPPDDWSGEPCYPVGYSWTGITCSNGTRVRVVSINLMNMTLSGYLSPAIGNLTALNTLLLGSNNLSGPIPSSLGALRNLEILGLENNRFDGIIPSSLGDSKNLRELHVENNNLVGSIPRNLLQKPGLNFSFTPGNNLSSR